ncbi:MAG: aspartate carbamoyltransferase catalytic subunit [Alphaproteobacteria bacterium]|nr:aspartate carbamoyltransferase catalytic subunit [Alphaproteobacteria bacterium]MBL6777666.1 aspartate carbamoyltransferase catalytic subunit [Alphaproteobacteria bacterium]
MNSTLANAPAAQLSGRHLLGIEGLAVPEIQSLISRSSYFADVITGKVKDDSIADILRGISIVNLFFENSTRTRVSFEVAAKHLGASVLNLSVSGSSVKKGETLIDTAVTLNAMHPDILVVRHRHAGTPLLLSKHVDASVINAGDGRHEHPTQALLDALTIQRRCGQIAGLKIAICGDVANSRVARSNLYLLGALGADVHFVSPSTLLPAGIDQFGVPVHTDLEAGIEGADIVMMLRLQTERMQGREIPSQHEYFNLFGLNTDKLMRAAPNALVMHPGPMNRGVEIDSVIADDAEKSLIYTQVEMGVAARMACLEGLAHKKSEAA